MGLLCPLWMCQLPHLQVFSNREALGTLSSWVFTQASSHRHNGLNHWPLCRHDCPWVGGGAETSNPLIKVGSLANLLGSLGAYQKSPHSYQLWLGRNGLLWIITHTHFIFIALKFFQEQTPNITNHLASKTLIISYVLGTGLKTKYVFAIINHSGAARQRLEVEFQAGGGPSLHSSLQNCLSQCLPHGVKK